MSNDKISITVKLSRKEMDEIKELFNLLQFDQKYWEIPWELYWSLSPVLDAFETAVKFEEFIKASKLGAGGRCKTCKHEVEMHSPLGEKICTKESCNCMSLKQEEVS